MSTVKNDQQPKTTTRPPTSPPVPTAAEAKAAAAAAKAKAEEGAEDIGGLTPAVTETVAPAVKRMPASEFKAISTDLRRATNNERMQPENAAAVVDAMVKMPRADFKALVDELATDPVRMAKFAAALEQDPETKATFVSLLEKKGYVSVEPAQSPPVPGSPRSPASPAGPAMLRDDPNLPTAIRQLVADEDISRAQSYKKDFDAYRKDYRAAVEGAATVGELRVLGPMAAPQSPEQLPGLTNLQDPNNVKYQAARGLDVEDIDTRVLLADQMRRLTGRPVAGDMSFTLEGKLLLKIGPPHTAAAIVGVEGAARFEKGKDQQVTGHVVRGVTVGGAVVESGGNDVVAGYHGHDNAAAVKVDAEGMAVIGNVGGFAGKVGLKGAEMSVGLGVNKSVDFGVGGVEAELIASVGFQGVTAQDSEAFVSTSQVGFFDKPPEIARGKSWSSLPEETRRTYEHQGWSDKEWSTAVDLQKGARRV